MIGDAFALMLDQIDKGRKGLREIVERDDGTFGVGGGWDYVAPFREWNVARLRGKFDSVVMYGNNFGMLGSQAVHLAYHERNRRAGRPPGAIRIRIRYQNHVTRWFDWLLVSPRSSRS